MIPQDTIEKILSLTHIEEVVGDFVALRKTGSSYKGCCPFHEEKTPSFSVSPAKGIYKCFGCGKAGNAITFIKEHEKCSYYEAIKYLGNKYHVEIVETELTDEEKQRKDLRESLMIVNEFATTFFVKHLWETPEGKAIGMAYFIERGFTQKTIPKFRLGYSPQKKDAFTSTAEKAGYKLEYMTKVGLSSVGDNYKSDKFHGRIMFPITSLTGSVIGFGGRVMTAANEHVQGGMKYINSPESEVYKKSFTLYGISFAKTEITKKDECILVEGYTDVLSLHQAGITNVVASSGTSLTNEQINLIKRFTHNIVIIYDGDKAGIKAATRGIDMILEKDMNVKVLLLPDGDDPDSFAKKHSSEEITEYINSNKTDFLTFRTKLAVEEIQNDPIKRAQFINEIALTITKIPNEINRMVYIQECSKILNIDEQTIKNQVTRYLGIQPKPYQTQQVQKVQTSIASKHVDKILENERDIIKLLVRNGSKTISIENSNILFEIEKHKWLQENPSAKKYPETNPTFKGLVKDYIFNELHRNLDETITFEFINEGEKKIFDEYYSKYEEKQDSIVDYLRDFVDAEQIANFLSDASFLDQKYWEKEKKIGTSEEEKKNHEEELLGNTLKESILEYIRRRYEQKREELTKHSDIESLKRLSVINSDINLISKQLGHTMR